VYKLIPASGTGVSGVNYDETDFGYDEMERQNRVVTLGGTITRTVYDARNNAVQVWIGTDDTGATNSDPTGGGAPGNNMVQVTGSQYDNGLGGGDNNLTQMTQYVDSSTTRVTSYLYDWRDRRTDTAGEVDFYEQFCYDNLDRVIRDDRRDTTATGNLIARFTTAYDDRGRVYQSITFGVDPTTGLVGNSLTSNIWYDAAGNALKNQPAGAQTFTKSVYDGIGRMTIRYTGYNLTDSSYANASSVATDTILEQVETAYDAASNVIQVNYRQRYHNAMGVGPLGSPSSAQPQARVTYAAKWPDALSRTAASANFGTNGGTPLSYPPTVPASSAAVLVSLTAYDNAGNVQSTTDPMGTISLFFYDAVGRQVQRILNYQALSSSSSGASSSSSGPSSSSSGVTGLCPASADTNVTILAAYNGDGNVSSVTAVNSTTGNQVTQYVYGTTLTASGIASSLLKVADVYPDSVGGSDQVSYTYNCLGEVTFLTDQNGTVHSYVYDLLGRKTEDCVTTAGIGIDTTMLRIETDYEVRGLVSGITSYDNATVGSGDVVNDVQLQYNSVGQLVADYQSHSGAVSIGTTPVVQYSYTDGSTNTVRLTAMTYPNGRVLNYDYGSSGGLNDALSRVESLIDDDGVTDLADYSYLGMASIVLVNESQPGLTYTLAGVTGGNDPITGDIYQGLDLYGRIKDLIWTSAGGSSSSSSSSSSSGVATIVEQVQHGYDLAGNRLWRADPVDANDQHDEVYDYDGLYRLNDFQRGGLNSSQTALVSEQFAQCWSLDETGNWSSFRQDSTGNGVWDLAQVRTSNPVNEITAIAMASGSPWATPTYDRAGNMTTMPQPATPTLSYIGVYDAWQRLTQLSAADATVASYSYDGLTRRTAKQVYVDGSLSTLRDYYYSVDWQSVEERTNGSTSPERQFIWGLRYVDDLLLRDRDPATTGVLTERLYALQDPNWNVTASATPAGVVQERYVYTAFGASSLLSPSFTPLFTSSTDWDTLYAGSRFDTDTSLYWLRNRAYHSALGRFIQRDPLTTFVLTDAHGRVAAQDLGLLQNLNPLWNANMAISDRQAQLFAPMINLYAYTDNRPLSNSDPFGLECGQNYEPAPVPPGSGKGPKHYPSCWFLNRLMGGGLCCSAAQAAAANSCCRTAGMHLYACGQWNPGSDTYTFSCTNEEPFDDCKGVPGAHACFDYFCKNAKMKVSERCVWLGECCKCPYT
jgi:RHS repeat-associated protein